ncbi:hypothetical protein [Nostoc sp. NMS4]|uniref:hypothetical protein n=1 Tax=Nostoc sp. NMS4 TaxID=2815390 RepID=UPI0025D2FA4A|nr:hypothetical protein [Nostoc sp. NMS4]MBN3921910.1 hypothetical protein [Nostoc sp. NMS4]
MSNEQNLKDIYDAINQAIDVAEVKADNALKSGNISQSEWQEAKDQWGKLKTTQLEIQGIMINKELQQTLLNNNLDSPRSKIEQATNSLNKSAGKIDDFNNFLSEIDKALKLAGSTIKFIAPLV